MNLEFLAAASVLLCYLLPVLREFFEFSRACVLGTALGR
jgi:hypothetical protein